ncbi:hypothetical protein LWI29_036974 [Acer saccharum]|uniref:Phytocyanin domain-containing protein n=1 Tax=Acer saccharum TaxID=4024 RepID=A0AA39SYE4_ACESA|nr:hypothetical protein LWI29_036974 [Acer saccharum]
MLPKGIGEIRYDHTCVDAARTYGVPPSKHGRRAKKGITSNNCHLSLFKQANNCLSLLAAQGLFNQAQVEQAEGLFKQAQGEQAEGLFEQARSLFKQTFDLLKKTRDEIAHEQALGLFKQAQAQEQAQDLLKQAQGLLKQAWVEQAQGEKAKGLLELKLCLFKLADAQDLLKQAMVEQANGMLKQAKGKLEQSEDLFKQAQGLLKQAQGLDSHFRDLENVYSAWFKWPTLKLCSTDLRKQISNKKRRRKDSAVGLFVFPVQSRVTGVKYSYQWMALAQQNNWHVLLDARSLGPKDMDSLGLSLFRPDFIITSFYRVFGDSVDDLDRLVGVQDDDVVEKPSETRPMSQLPAFSGAYTSAQVKDVFETELDHDNSSDRDGTSTILEKGNLLKLNMIIIIKFQKQKASPVVQNPADYVAPVQLGDVPPSDVSPYFTAATANQNRLVSLVTEYYQANPAEHQDVVGCKGAPEFPGCMMPQAPGSSFLMPGSSGPEQDPSSLVLPQQPSQQDPKASVLGKRWKPNGPLVNLFILASLLLVPEVHAQTIHIVGARSGWNSSLSHIKLWAENKTFHVGDSLVFIYEPPLSVLVVNREAYHSCNTQDYIAMYYDGQTNLELRNLGPQYFIGGKNYCKTGVKLEINVLPELPS